MPGIGFFDINYLEYSTTITGTDLVTSTAGYGYDNRSDMGNVTWADANGTIDYELGGAYFYVTDFFILHHNCDDLVLLGNTGTSWATIGSGLSASGSSLHITANTFPAYGFRIVISSTVANAAAYIGEIIITTQKFTLNYNPNGFDPKIIPVGEISELYTGKSRYSEVGNKFVADLSWDILVGDVNSMTGTDYENITELARTKTSFLIWCNNSTTTYPNIRPWRAEDIYKCKIYDPASYIPLGPKIEYGKGSFRIEEVE